MHKKEEVVTVTYLQNCKSSLFTWVKKWFSELWSYEMIEMFGINYLMKELEFVLINTICQVRMHLLQAVTH